MTSTQIQIEALKSTLKSFGVLDALTESQLAYLDSQIKNVVTSAMFDMTNATNNAKNEILNSIK